MQKKLEFAPTMEVLWVLEAFGDFFGEDGVKIDFTPPPLSFFVSYTRPGELDFFYSKFAKFLVSLLLYIFPF